MKTRRVNDGSSSDTEFSWMTKNLGAEWSVWQFAATHFVEYRCKEASPAPFLYAIKTFVGKYLYKCAPYTSDVSSLFTGENDHRCSTEELENFLVGNVGQYERYRIISIVVEFVEYILDNLFSEEDDTGTLTRMYSNPFTKTKHKLSYVETVRNPLPYRYIKDLREILCPLPDKVKLAAIEQSLKPDETLLPSYHYRHFKHWEWSQGLGIGNAEWFKVDEALIDKSDPDCVWRVSKNCGGKEVFEIWSPAKAMLVFIKLHLPLRTYQVRMLDSGEADTWRYEKGQWVLNDRHDFALGTKKRPFGKGVFRRIYDTLTGQVSSGLYINTNKTADKNKEEIERGYVIPWHHQEVLYWLEKLRNWQEKYNPIEKPTNCFDLKQKHWGNKKSNAQIEAMGEISFLFRNSARPFKRDVDKPFGNADLSTFWYKLLKCLEDKTAEKGDTLVNGKRMRLVDPNSQVATLFPMHSLRVSLITAYTMNTDLPLPVVSKLLAGHSRLLMTIYYNKITPSVMAEKMREAECQLDKKSKQGVRNFLQDASMEQIQCKMVYHKEDSVKAALVNRNPVGWEDRTCGLCLVGGNTIQSDESFTIGGCWNGGELVKDSESAKNRIYDSVPHGPENCVRCRWFITEARYLPALNAQFNQLSYKAHQAANLSVEIESELEALKDEQFLCEDQDKPFTKHSELQSLQRRYEKQQVEADEYAKDWIACFELINKIIHVEEARTDADTKDKLIAVGVQQDVSYALKFVETKSELLHLSLLCDDAEFYPDLQDELRKTPAIQKRSMQLSRVLMKKGFEPIFLEMDEKQQLIAANAMLRQMAKIADPDDKLEGYRKVANYIEAGEYLEENKLFNAGISALTNKALHLKKTTQPALLEG